MCEIVNQIVFHMAQINFQNPEQLIYQNEILTISVLGGIKIEGLDRMRCTLKVKHNNTEYPPLRHNLDLYNDSQSEKFIRKACNKLELGMAVVSASITELTEELEKYRLSELESQNTKEAQCAPLTEEERANALDFLQAPNLLERTNALIAQSGVVGEEVNRLIMYLVFTTRKTERPLHVVSLGASGTGKTHLQEKVSELIPEDEKIEVTTLSENALYYFGQQELKNKLILIEDLDGVMNLLYTLRELMSKRKISKRVTIKDTQGRNKTVPLVVEGPVSVAGCTTHEQIYEDNANRSFLLYLDDSYQQDQRIMDYQRSQAAGLISYENELAAQQLLKNVQKTIEPIKVINPYAPYLQLPKAVFKPRRTNMHYLQFIEAITFYHQCQRHQYVDEQTGEVYIKTTLEDIKEANKLLAEVLLRKSDTLTGACRNYFERLKKWLAVEEKLAFTNTQARKALRENHSNQKRYMLQLQRENLIKKLKGDKKKGFYYQVASLEDYQNLQNSIHGVLNGILENLPQAVQSSTEVQSISEPLKTTPVKESSKKFTKNQKKASAPIKKEQLRAKIIPLGQSCWDTYKVLEAHKQEQPGSGLSPQAVAALTDKSKSTEQMSLKKLTKAGLIICNREQMPYTYQIA